MKFEICSRESKSHRIAPIMVEALECRQLCYALVPAGYTVLETVQIRPAAGTYQSGLTLLAKTPYFLLATGKTETAANVFHGDAAFVAGATSTTAETTTWGITATAGTTTSTTADWGAFQGDSIYGQTFTPASTGALSFAFANDGTDKISTLAVTIYAPPPTPPAVKVSTIKDDAVSGSVAVASLPSKQIFLPLDNADWDQNGTADNKQSGAVPGDKFLLPITLPAVSGSTSKSHTYIEAPHGLRVWLKSNRTGTTVGIGIRSDEPRTVYVEGTAEQPKGASVNLRVLLPVGGVQVEELVPITVFTMSGPTTATGGSTQKYSSDATAVSKWQMAMGGKLDIISPSVGNTTSANVTWNDTTEIGYADFDADSDYIWGWPVEVTA